MTMIGSPYVPPPLPPPSRTIVEIVARRGGWARAFGCAAGLLLIGAIFITGVVLGAFAVLGRSAIEPTVFEQRVRDGGRRQVAIIPIDGIIDERMSNFVALAVNRVAGDSDIAAVVLRVESPGGGVTASDQIWQQLERLRGPSGRNIPVVASYGGVAASGGYFVSCGSSQIWAEPTTITGSIGVLAQIFTLEGLMDKIGVQPITLVASGSPQKDVANDMFRAWTPEDRAKIQVVLDSAYKIFTERVLAGRKATLPTMQAVQQVATGAIFTADQAVAAGLVDHVGYLEDAIRAAEVAAAIPRDSATVIRLLEPPTFLGDGLGIREHAPGASALSALDASGLRRLANELASPRIMYLMGH